MNVKNKEGDVDTLRAGRYFGESSLLVSCPRDITVEALDYVDLFALARTDMEEILKNFPNDEAGIQMIAHELYPDVMKLAQSHSESALQLDE